MSNDFLKKCENCKNYVNHKCKIFLLTNIHQACEHWEEKIYTIKEVCENSKKEIEQINDSVNHPSHYTDGNIEVMDFIEDKQLNFARGNVIKYVSRAGKKDSNKELEDLKKASWYLNREIERLNKETD